MENNINENMHVFCALNIFDGQNKLINRNNCPLMYIWDSSKDLIESIRDKEFLNWVEDNMSFNFFENYLYGYIVGFSYKKDKYSEKEYDEINIKIQELYPLEVLDNFSNNIILSIMKNLYKMAFKDDNVKNLNILDIYNHLKNKYKDKISKETIIQAVRSQIQTNEKYNKLSYNNQEFLINKLKEILNNYEV
ncbi:MAG: hypothetical protein J1F35_06415 [Erysipelotrichales bacterium]|nr:hypothetical protein [Erysipelotrichales bacterium]